MDSAAFAAAAGAEALKLDMKAFLTALFVAALVGQARAGEPNTLAPDEAAAGWRLLFDGKSLTGWGALGGKPLPAKGWTVEEGTIHHAKGGGGDIVTTELFGDFELAWEWKISHAGNSGLKYLLPDAAKPVGFEYQLLDDENHPDGIKGGRLHQTAGLYDLIEPAAAKKVNPVGQWNQSRIVVKGGHVEHWLNGEKTLEYEIGSAAMEAAIARSKYKTVPGFGKMTRSPLLLQDHGDEVWFRSIKVRAPQGR